MSHKQTYVQSNVISIHDPFLCVEYPVVGSDTIWSLEYELQKLNECAPPSIRASYKMKFYIQPCFQVTVQFSYQIEAAISNVGIKC